MDSVRAAAAAHAASTSTSSTTARSSTRTADGKDFATMFADAKKDLKRGETLSRVTGHEYARIRGGTQDGQCVNLSGNARTGQTFDLIWRDGRQFHVYGGRGADHKVVEVGHRAASTRTTSGTDTTTSSSGTSSTGSGTSAADSSASTNDTSTSGTSSTTGNASDTTTRASDVSASGRS